ncbi:MAG: xanthine dehydrogenase family protein molybdopterin-binding subunit [Ferruginibacter sp.]
MNLFDDTVLFSDDDRVDGKLKVTGAAKYAAEYNIPNTAYGVLVGSTIAKGTIQSVDIAEAKKAPGVIDIIYHDNTWKVENLADEKKAASSRAGLRIFHTNEVFSYGQPVALVVADHLEQAQYAAGLVKISYAAQAHNTDFEAAAAKAKNEPYKQDDKRGDVEAWKNAAVKIEREYNIPIEVHSPMEMHATIAVWEGDDKLTVYDKNHAVKDVQRSIAGIFGLKRENVFVQAEFVGGGFGSGLRVWPHCIAAIIAAKKLNRPVKVTLSRPQMFTMVGYRPQSWQKISLGATKEGVITGAVHASITNTSAYENFGEDCTGITQVMYNFPNLRTMRKTVALNLGTPIWMRAPGEASGTFALESAMDELAHQLKMDPLQLRIVNYADKNPDNNLPWSSNYLKQCYELAAQKFGWKNRKATPRSKKEGDWLVGMGMGGGTWSAWRSGATVRALLDNSGNLLLQSATSDMGPGTATAMVAIAGEAMGMDKSKIRFELGNSRLPDSPGQGGSVTTASVGSAVHNVCQELKKKLAELAAGDPKFKVEKADMLVFADGKITLKDNSASVAYEALLKAAGQNNIDITKTSTPGPEGRKYAFNSFAVHFAEVKVHSKTGEIKVTKVVSAVDAGKIVSERTAASQIKGAVVWGIGMALTEEQKADPATGKLSGKDFETYHVPRHVEVPAIDVIFVNQPDPYLNPMGSKGLGEVGLLGSAAAIANAVFNATGKRITSLPITPDKLKG